MATIYEPWTWHPSDGGDGRMLMVSKEASFRSVQDWEDQVVRIVEWPTNDGGLLRQVDVDPDAPYRPSRSYCVLGPLDAARVEIIRACERRDRLAMARVIVRRLDEATGLQGADRRAFEDLVHHLVHEMETEPGAFHGDEEDDEPPACSACGGSGGGPDPALRCRVCGGRGVER